MWNIFAATIHVYTQAPILRRFKFINRGNVAITAMDGARWKIAIQLLEEWYLPSLNNVLSGLMPPVSTIVVHYYNLNGPVNTWIWDPLGSYRIDWYSSKNPFRVEKHNKLRGFWHHLCVFDSICLNLCQTCLPWLQTWMILNACFSASFLHWCVFVWHGFFFGEIS